MFWLAVSTHVRLSLLALAIGCLLSTPLGVYVVRRRLLAPQVLGLFSGLRVVPSLAILFLAVPYLGLGFYPALVALAVLAFALSFDEVIVTTFTAGQQETLPIWVFNQLTKPRQRPVTNIVAVFVFAATFMPILLAHRLTRDADETAGSGR